MAALFFLRIVVHIFRLVPFQALYMLSDVLAFLLYRLIGYRKNVIIGNLKRAFPEKKHAEIKKIAWQAYLNLTDVTLETLKAQSMPLAETKRRCIAMNPEIVAEYLIRGQSVIVAGSHYGNWEYAGLTMPEGLLGKLVGVYKPMTNKAVESFVNQKRGQGGLVLVPMEESVAVMRKQHKKEAWAYMLIADQSPSSRKRAHWVEFFGQETACLPGVDVLARTFGFPVFSYQIKRVRRGYYEIEYSPLWMDPETAAEGDITRAYNRRLEDEITENPGAWLWSHKRWKMRRET